MLFDFLKKKSRRFDAMQQASAQYFEGVQRIETMWSILYNLKQYNGDPADALEKACYDNLKDLETMLEASRAAGYDDTRPSEVAAYIRLCMLYEKQGLFDKAVQTCATAIRSGAVHVGSKGLMYGRLARLLRKAGRDQEPELLALIQGRG